MCFLFFSRLDRGGVFVSETHAASVRAVSRRLCGVAGDGRYGRLVLIFLIYETTMACSFVRGNSSSSLIARKLRP